MNTVPHAALPADARAAELLPAQRRALLAGIGGLAAGALLAGSRTAHAGPLDPPVGPIAPTQKPLDEVEPRIAINAANTPGDSSSVFKITQPGSYYLTANVFGSVGKSGIVVEASGVTIDLNGFAIVGTTGAIAGVFVNSGNSTTIRNGFVTNWPTAGVFDSGSCGIIEHVRALANGTGIRSSDTCVIKDCTARGNTDIGIDAINGSVVVNCTAVSNGSFGIRADRGVILDSCTLANNTGGGARLFENALLRNSVFQNNPVQGASVGNSCAVLGSLFINNPIGLLITGTDTRVEGNQFLRNIGAGLRVSGTGNIILRNVASGNTPNWDIAALNALAQILTATINGSNVVGNTFPGNLGTTDPTANFTY